MNELRGILPGGPVTAGCQTSSGPKDTRVPCPGGTRCGRTGRCSAGAERPDCSDGAPRLAAWYIHECLCRGRRSQVAGRPDLRQLPSRRRFRRPSGSTPLSCNGMQLHRRTRSSRLTCAQASMGRTWSDWQTAVAQQPSTGAWLSQLFVLRPFTSWLQYRVRFTAVADSPLLNDVTLTYLNSMAGPSLIDLVGRVPPTGPPTLTPVPLSIAGVDWGVSSPGGEVERQQPHRVILTEISCVSGRSK